MESIIGSTLIGKNGPVSVGTINTKFILLYFSAHWCPPCRGFTPKLRMFYDAVNAAGKQVEVIYVSRDKRVEQFNEYYSEMPWIAIPYEDKDRNFEVGLKYNVRKMPTLILVDQMGNMKRNSCRKDVVKKGPGCLVEWEQVLNS